MRTATAFSRVGSALSADPVAPHAHTPTLPRSRGDHPDTTHQAIKRVVTTQIAMAGIEASLCQEGLRVRVGAR